MNSNNTAAWLRAAILSAALLALAAPAALADPPGYDFLDWTRIFAPPAAKDPIAAPVRARTDDLARPLPATPNCG